MTNHLENCKFENKEIYWTDGTGEYSSNSSVNICEEGIGYCSDSETWELKFNYCPSCGIKIIQ